MDAKLIVDVLSKGNSAALISPWNYFFMNNVRDTTNFTTKYLQTDMTSYMDITHQQLKHQITNLILTFNINKSLIVNVLYLYRMPCQFVSISL